MYVKIARYVASGLAHIPGVWPISQRMPPRQSVRCVLFHNIAESTNPFTRGLDVTISPKQFEECIQELARRYTFVDLDFLIAGSQAARPKNLRPPLLITFDDGYSGVISHAAPVCVEYGAPSILFLNGSTVGNKTVALDNLIAYVANTRGVRSLSSAAGQEIRGIHDAIHGFVPRLDRSGRKQFKASLDEMVDQDAGAMAASSDLYVSESALESASEYAMEIGNHTWSHPHLRQLSEDELDQEIRGARYYLRQKSGQDVRAFSFPYGSRVDATPLVRHRIQAAGHDVVFFAEALPNRATTGRRDSFDRVTITHPGPGGAFASIEIQSRFRILNNG